MKKFSFRFFAISTFAFLSLMMVVSILYTQFIFSQDISKKATSTQFDILSLHFSHEMNNLNTSHQAFVELLSSFVKEENIKQIFEKNKKYLDIYANFLNNHTNIYAFYIGTENNDFFSVRRVNKNEKIIKNYMAKDTDKWFTREIENGYEKRTYYDKNFNPTFFETIKTKYKPANRPWFKKAKLSNGNIVRTDLYKFDMLGIPGITYAKTYKKGYVFGLDLLLRNIDKMLKEGVHFTSQNSCIIDKQFHIIAKTKSINAKIANKIFKAYKKDPNNNTIKIEDSEYMYRIKPFGDDFHITYIDLNALMLPYKDNAEKNLFIGAIIVLILCLSIWYLASIAINPILSLAKENKKIASRNFKDIKPVKSIINEISDLSTAMVSTAKSIQEYQEKLERLSITDSLTKIYNRTKLNSTLPIMIDDFNRYGYKFGVIMIDIDFFKQVNDKHGHQIGDQVLVEFANILKQEVRHNDIVGRWGGEEFVIICKEINEMDLEKLAQKLRKNIELHKFKTIGHKTASFGITICQENDSVERLMQRADDALYKAKENGRNKVVIG